jgi:hypothetical protein
MTRYVNLWFAGKRSDETYVERERSLITRRPAYLRVQIAPYDARTLLEAATPFPSQESIEQAYRETRGKPIPLEVAPFSDDFDIPQAERVQRLTLVAREATAMRYFQVTPRRDGDLRLRVCVFYRNHLLKSLSVSALADASGSRVLPAAQRARVELTFSADFGNADQLSGRAVWLGINEWDGGSHSCSSKATTWQNTFR